MPAFLNCCSRGKRGVLLALLTFPCFIYSTHITFVLPRPTIIESGNDRAKWGNILDSISRRIIFLENEQDQAPADSVEYIAESIRRMKVALCSMNRLAHSNQVYTIVYNVDGVGYTDYDPQRQMIVFHVDSTRVANFIHEATHGEQFEIGSIAYTLDSGKGYGDDCMDEVEAYKQQFAYDPATVTELDRPALIHSFADITAEWVKKHPVYASIPRDIITVDTDTAALNRAYPSHTGGWKSRSRYPLHKKRYYLFRRVQADTSLNCGKLRMGA